MCKENTNATTNIKSEKEKDEKALICIFTFNWSRNMENFIENIYNLVVERYGGIKQKPRKRQNN